MGASTVKYTIPLPCIGFSESGSILYINFEFFEGKKSITFEKHIDLQSQEIHVDKKISRKVYLF